MRVHSFESMAAVDGEGLRTSVFLCGCHLRCVCCHNPDTWDVDAGYEMTVEELAAKVRRFLPYFRASGGGVTFSGGEPLLQADEIVRAAKLLSLDGINVTLDTSGDLPMTDAVLNALDAAALVICDLKYPDAASYAKYTGGNFSRVLDFLRCLAEKKCRVWLRTVVIPGINDSEKMMEAYVQVIKEHLPRVEKYELLPFHTLGFFKYEKLGVANFLANTQPLSEERLSALQKHVDTLLPLSPGA